MPATAAAMNKLPPAQQGQLRRQARQHAPCAGRQRRAAHPPRRRSGHPAPRPAAGGCSSSSHMSKGLRSSISIGHRHPAATATAEELAQQPRLRPQLALPSRSPGSLCPAAVAAVLASSSSSSSSSSTSAAQQAEQQHNRSAAAQQRQLGEQPGRQSGPLLQVAAADQLPQHPSYGRPCCGRRGLPACPCSPHLQCHQ